MNLELRTAEESMLRVCTKMAEKALASYHLQNHSELISLIRESNAYYENIAPMTPALLGRVKRWDLSRGKIPVHSVGDVRAEHALDILEKAMGYSIFERNVSVEDILQAERGLIFSIGTAAPAPGREVDDCCKGSVGGEVRTGCMPYDLCDPEKGDFRKPLYVDLDGPQPEGGIADITIAIHELAHALGLGREFQGFGIGAPISTTMFSVIKKLYETPVGERIP